MSEEKKCYLCKTSCSIYAESDNIDGITQPIYSIECPFCGYYAITNNAKRIIEVEQLRSKSLHIISATTRIFWIRNSTPFTITAQMIKDDSEFEKTFLNTQPKTIPDKIALLLQYIANKSNYPGDVININIAYDYPICFSKDANELDFYLRHLQENGDTIERARIISQSERPCELFLTTKGWESIEKLNKPNIESKQVFVAMWFDDSMDNIFADGIKPIEKETGFNTFRVDKSQFIDEKICDKIIMEIKRSRFLIVDVTGGRNAVYFEAGYAMGMGLPIIWTCKESKVAEDCCLDTRQYNHIFWENSEDLKTQLKERILVTIGHANNS